MCECGKGYVMPKYLTEASVDAWGPPIWKLLHVLSTRLGSKDEGWCDADAAVGFYFVINQLYKVLPCAECQLHAKNYLATHKFDPRGLIGDHLRNYVEMWLLDFHNAVRIRKSQDIIIKTVEMYHTFWSMQNILPCEDAELKLYFDYGKMYKIIRVDDFARWANQLTRLRLLLHI